MDRCFDCVVPDGMGKLVVFLFDKSDGEWIFSVKDQRVNDVEAVDVSLLYATLTSQEILFIDERCELSNP